jgi:uncharacterized protein (TIGR04255 family)
MIAPMTSANPDDVYPNSPLKAVVFEIRFAGEPAVECHPDMFFEKVRSDFPQVFVPTIAQGAAVALAPYQFVSRDGHQALLTSINLFAFKDSAYRGFANFEARPFVGWKSLRRCTRLID